MTNHIRIHNTTIPYTVHRSKRARRVRLTVHRDGTVVLTLPSIVPSIIGKKFIRQKADWLLRTYTRTRRSHRQHMHNMYLGEYTQYRDQAYHFVTQKVEQFNNHYGFTYNKIMIRNQKTCWGSCSELKNLSFNYKLLFLPEQLAEYVIVHELCHLQELNHSKQFWKLVGQTIPNYKDRKKELDNLNL